MVQAMIQIEEKTNQVLNIVKAMYGLKHKSEAIDLVVHEYEKSFLDPEIQPNYIKNAMRIHQQVSIKVGTIENLRKRIEK